MSGSLFQLPDEQSLSALTQAFPCREQQIRALAALLYPAAAPCQNLVVYGTEATGKSAITTALLSRLSEPAEDDAASPAFGLRHAIVNSAECITARHLFETVVGKVADALRWHAAPSRCETVSQLAVELARMLKDAPRPAGFRFVLVFDAVDRQRDAPHTLLPALARLSEIIPCLTTVFIVTSPPPSFLRTASVPHLHFPAYTKPEFVAILSTTTPPPAPALPNTTASETADLWARFAAAVHDALARAAARTLPAFRHACAALWPRFTAPIFAGTHSAREFTRLLVAARLYFHDERLLDPGVLAVVLPPPPKPADPKPTTTTTTTQPALTTSVPTSGAVANSNRPVGAAATVGTNAGTALASLLPPTPRLLLLASYLASHNATRHDVTLFSTHYHRRRRRRGGGSGAGGRSRSKHRKIARKLLGAHAFVLERMLAIYAAVRGEWEGGGVGRDEARLKGEVGGEGDGGSVDVAMGIATLASLRLLVRVGGAGAAGAGDPMDRGGKWRVNVGWEVIRGLGRAVGVEVEEWLID